MTDYHQVSDIDKAKALSIESSEEVIEDPENKDKPKPKAKITDEIEDADSSNSPLNLIKGFFSKISKSFEEAKEEPLPKNYITAKGITYDEVYNKLKCKWSLQMGIPINNIEIYRLDDSYKKFTLLCELTPGAKYDHKVVFREYTRMFPYKSIIHGYAEIP
jgi:hypothetical protein